MRQCALPPPAVSCTPELSTGVGGVTYDAERCLEARTLAARGVSPSRADNVPLFRLLGRRYRVVYDFAGALPLAPSRLAFLMEDLPLAARLVTHLRNVAYSAEYLSPDRRRFRLRREDSLEGRAEQVSGSPDVREVYYFGSGSSRLGPWRLRGQGLVHATWQPAPGGGLRYRIRVLVTPNNAFVNAFMRLGVFRSAVEGRIDEVLADITTASAALDRQGLDAVAWTSWPAEEKKKVERLLALR